MGKVFFLLYPLDVITLGPGRGAHRKVVYSERRRDNLQIFWSSHLSRQISCGAAGSVNDGSLTGHVVIAVIWSSDKSDSISRGKLVLRKEKGVKTCSSPSACVCECVHPPVHLRLTGLTDVTFVPNPLLPKSPVCTVDCPTMRSAAGQIPC